MYTPNSTAKKKKVQTHRPTLKSDDKELMLSVLIRNPAAFECAASLLTYEDFSDHERGFALAWKVAKDYFAAEGQLPSKTLMLANVRQALGDDPEFLMESERDELDCWLEKAFDAKHWEEDITSSAAHCTWAIKALKRHLTEQNASAAHAVRENGRVVIDVVGFLDDCRLRQEKINALGDACNAPLKLISAAEWHKQQGKLTFLIPGRAAGETVHGDRGTEKGDENLHGRGHGRRSGHQGLLAGPGTVASHSGVQGGLFHRRGLTDAQRAAGCDPR